MQLMFTAIPQGVLSLSKFSRSLAGLVAIAALAGLVQAQTAKPIDPAVAAYRSRLDSQTPASVLAFLKSGNERFAAGKSTQGGQNNDARERIRLTGEGQRGLAVVLTCIDSRVPPELLFDTSVGDLYTVRMGANTVSDDVLGSLEVAVASGARVLLVMGHTRCAGVRAACAGMELEHFTALLNRVKPAIAHANQALDADKQVAERIGAREASNHRYVSYVSDHNARHQANEILRRSKTVREAVAKGETWLIPAMYEIETGNVKFEAPLK
jgi:carbonic anhydrase